MPNAVYKYIVNTSTCQRMLAQSACVLPPLTQGNENVYMHTHLQERKHTHVHVHMRAHTYMHTSLHRYRRTYAIKRVYSSCRCIYAQLQTSLPLPIRAHARGHTHSHQIKKYMCTHRPVGICDFQSIIDDFSLWLFFLDDIRCISVYVVHAKLIGVHATVHLKNKLNMPCVNLLQLDVIAK